MIFAISIGSTGSEPERYVASIPFVLAPGATLGPFEEQISKSIGAFDLRLEKLHHVYTLTCGPFPSEAEASAAVAKLVAGLLWLSLAHGVGVQYSKEQGPVTLFDAPRPIPEGGPIFKLARIAGWTATDGHYEAEKVIVRPDHKRLIRFENGRATITVGIGIDNFFDSMQRALSFPTLRDVVRNDKLKLAIELYAAYRFELSKNTQLITLVTALEALLPETEISALAKDTLAHAKETVQGERDKHSKESTEWSDLDRLLSRVGKLKLEAIGTGIRNYVTAVISRHPQLGEPEEVSVNLRDAYSVRSTLLHDGRCTEDDITKSLSFLCEFVPRLLTALFEETASA